MQNLKSDRNSKVKEMAKKGLTYSQIGKEMNISKQRVHQIVKDIHISGLNPRPSKLDENIVQDYNATRVIES
jgi:orotate phosphoribosyltransferase-like protein